MAVQAYKQPKQNWFAVNVARSWLAAVGIKVTESGTPGCDLLIPSADGGPPIELALVASFDATPDVDCLAVLATEIGNAKLNIALDAFHVITEVAGHGRPTPVDRGIAPPQKEYYGQDMFFVASRHQQFRASPNLSKHITKTYEPTVMRACRGVFARNTKLCLRHGFGVDDLATYAWIWTHIFFHRYQVAKPTHKNGDDNQRLLTQHLKQRFSEFIKLVMQYGRSAFPSVQDAEIALLGRVADASEYVGRGLRSKEFSDGAGHDFQNPIGYSFDPRSPEEPVDENAKEISASRRRRAAVKLLNAALEDLPHDDMVHRLKEAAESPQRDYSTKREARRRLLVHFKSCPMCQEMGLSLRPLDGGDAEEVLVRSQEDAPGGDVPSAAEDGHDIFG
jgi:hypothetical protein